MGPATFSESRSGTHLTAFVSPAGSASPGAWSVRESADRPYRAVGAVRQMTQNVAPDRQASGSRQRLRMVSRWSALLITERARSVRSRVVHSSGPRLVLAATGRLVIGPALDRGIQGS